MYVLNLYIQQRKIILYVHLEIFKEYKVKGNLKEKKNYHLKIKY